MTMLSACQPGPQISRTEALLADLHVLALTALARMFRSEQRLFAFRLRRTPEGSRLEGSSHRYTAIALIGLAEASADAAREVLHGHSREEICERLLDQAPSLTNLGDVALSHWAGLACGTSPRRSVRERLTELMAVRSSSTIELSWALAALSEDAGGCGDALEIAFRRLAAACDERSGLFPHRAGRGGNLFRGHVTSFADQVSPIHALSRYHIASGDEAALRIATRCADRVCALLGPAGQWWWHYDVRTGHVVEAYPVYAVHQDAMAPMALFELAAAGGPNHRDAVERGLDWLQAAPELGGGSLIDEREGLIWRKVGRREPRKLVRGIQALASRLHPALRVPGTDNFFPPDAVDEECRPYHLGWLLYAWRALRAGLGSAEGSAP
jgi:hypothetical protein